jgi:hypothetical protein
MLFVKLVDKEDRDAAPKQIIERLRPSPTVFPARSSVATCGTPSRR